MKLDVGVGEQIRAIAGNICVERECVCMCICEREIVCVHVCV